MDDLKRKSLFRVSKELLEQILLLPADAKVTSVTLEQDRDGFVFVVEGDGLPVDCTVSPGHLLLWLNPKYGSGKFVGWE